MKAKKKYESMIKKGLFQNTIILQKKCMIMKKI